MRKACVKPVYCLSTVPNTAVGLWTVPSGRPQHPVYVSVTYTSSMPIFVLALVHRFFNQLTEVINLFMTTIHKTNKYQYKYKLRITQ